MSESDEKDLAKVCEVCRIPHRICLCHVYPAPKDMPANGKFIKYVNLDKDDKILLQVMEVTACDLWQVLTHTDIVVHSIQPKEMFDKFEVVFSRKNNGHRISEALQKHED